MSTLSYVVAAAAGFAVGKWWDRKAAAAGAVKFPVPPPDHYERIPIATSHVKGPSFTVHFQRFCMAIIIQRDDATGDVWATAESDWGETQSTNITNITRGIIIDPPSAADPSGATPSTKKP